eukprot:GHVR01042935.1.p1 GENE.GHVR01042935.1~~GHVR01042935.1.p1  ORF type:complete len:317 (-),score=71.75 GHVR01042935.1:156-1106(-)
MISNLDALLSKAMKCELLDEQLIALLCELVRNILLKESNVKSVRTPVTLVGDVHGQFYDLLELFKVGGRVPDTNYLFLGDYVDRGSHSVETITLLCCLKARYPDRITLLRGNHECRQITQVYGFYAECTRKYNTPQVWQHFTEMFDYLPVAALIDNTFLALHGGLSPSLHTIDQVRMLDRYSESPHEGPLADLVWSDPDDERSGFSISPRGAGYMFGRDVADTFLHLNNLHHIIRAHQLCMEGYNICLEGAVITVWSAPNYCYRFNNAASCLEIADDVSKHFNLFTCAPESERNFYSGGVGCVQSHTHTHTHTQAR